MQCPRPNIRKAFGGILKDKIISLIGFAIKAGKVVFGADNIIKNKKIYLIVCCKTLSINSLENIKVAVNGKIPIIISQNPLCDITYKKGVKVLGVTDKQMSSAIIKNLSDNFILA